MLDATCFEFVSALPQSQRNTTKMCPTRAARAAVSGCNFFFHSIG